MSPRAPRAERNFEGDGDVPDQRIFATLAATHPSRELSDHMLTILGSTVGPVFGVARCDIAQSSRGRASIALARQVAMYLGHVVCGMNMTEVGRAFARDRTTVAHACSVIEDRRDDPQFDRVLELLERIVQVLSQPHSDKQSN